MRLLVSVRSALEAESAVDGGADIIDAKEPARGSLGAVDPAVLEEIASRLPPAVPLSVALGDLARPDDAYAAVAALLPGRPAPAFVKVGFAGVESPARIERVVRAAAAAAGARAERPAVVAVAYADHAEARTVSPAELVPVARLGGAAGVLVDTWTKDGRTLFDWIPGPELAQWVAGVRRQGLLAAVAGSLDQDALGSVLFTAADIVGVRGAACDGDRTGAVSPVRVRRLKGVLTGSANSRLSTV